VLVAIVALSTRRTAIGAVLAPVARFPALVGMTIATALLVAQAVVVDMVEDVRGPGRGGARCRCRLRAARERLQEPL
jgi:hypothetical protein